jgi:hypothetical protein
MLLIERLRYTDINNVVCVYITKSKNVDTKARGIAFHRKATKLSPGQQTTIENSNAYTGNMSQARPALKFRCPPSAAFLIEKLFEIRIWLVTAYTAEVSSLSDFPVRIPH